MWHKDVAFPFSGGCYVTKLGGQDLTERNNVPAV